MNEELNNDPLERFFKKEFEGFEAEPDDGMWAQIEANIPPKPKLMWWLLLKKIGLPLILLLGLTAIGIAIWQYQHAHYLASELERKSREIDALEEEIAMMQKGDEKMVEAKVQVGIQEEAKAEEEALGRGSDIAEIPGDGTDFRLRTIQSGQSNLLVETINNLKKETIEEDKNDQRLNIAGSRTLKQSVHLSANLDVGPLSALPGRSPAFLMPLRQPENLSSLLKSSQKDGPAFYYGFFAEMLFANQDLGYQPQFIFGSVKTNEIHSGIGMFAGLQINARLGIQSGLGFRWYNFNLQDAASLIYTFENTSTNPEGQVIGNYRVAELGEISLVTQVKNNVQNDGSDIQEGAAFNLVYDLYYQLQYYTLPLQVTYSMGRQRFKTQLAGGLLLHSTFGDKLQERFINLSFNRLAPSNLEIEVNTLKHNFLELGLGFNFHYEWPSGLSSGLGATFYQAITPMANKTHQTLGLNLNFNYRFTSNQNKK